MGEISEWHGIDLVKRRRKIEKAFKMEEIRSPEDVPVVINVPSYPCFGSLTKPKDYFTNPASMLEWQEQAIELHLQNIDDDYVPYLIPWYGTGVLSSCFGCQIKFPEDSRNDPMVVTPCVKEIKDIFKLKTPDFYNDGLAPRVIETIDYMRKHSSFPVSLTDMQGPLDTLGQMCGHSRLYIWMYEEPQMVHELLDLVTDAFIEWVKVQKKHTGEPLDQGYGLEGVWAPPGVGIWESDDDLIAVSPRLYEEFIVPRLSKIFNTFKGGIIHYCGNGSHQIENFLKVKGLRAINNSPMGNLKAFRTLREKLGSILPLQIQDIVPEDIEGYYSNLFSEVINFQGIIVAPYFVDSIAMDNNGGYIELTRDPIETAKRVVEQVRRSVDIFLKNKN